MIQYSRSGLYVPRKKKTKKRAIKKGKSVDWVNMFLFVLLFVVALLFILT